MQDRKKQISAKIIADSKNEFGDRITTFVLTFPRFILAELNTHRVFSRNSASSRAIPFNKMLKMVEEDPFIPIAWQKDHKGMQGTEYFEDNEDLEDLRTLWLNARDNAKNSAIGLSVCGTTKQLCNRILEPFMWHTAIVTATEFENFFKQRCPQYKGNSGCFWRSKKDYLQENNISTIKEYSWLERNKGQGEIHIMALAEAMWDAYNESEPKQLKAGEWYIPFGDKFKEYGDDEFDIDCLYAVIKRNTPSGSYVFPHQYNKLLQEYKVRIATARCARVSYLNFEGKDDYEADIKLHDRLAEMAHWSPFEHCAQSMNKMRYFKDKKSRNFTGFIQYRELIEKQQL